MRNTAPAWPITRLTLPALFVGFSLVAACGDDPVLTSDAGVDATTDAAMDATADIGEDTTADTTPDAVEDTVSDVTTDTVEDVAPDVSTDAVEDTTSDVTVDASDDTADVTTDVPADVPSDTSTTPDLTCNDPGYTPGACVAIEDLFAEAGEVSHIDEPEPLTYAAAPPSSGDHRPQWGQWGEYVYIPQERWVHNLEHGGIVFLYHPCASTETVDALRQIATSQPADDGGRFRYILTPYPDLPSDVAVMAWEQTGLAECVNPTDIGAFIDEHYRTAPEDVPSEGAFNDQWLTR